MTERKCKTCETTFPQRSGKNDYCSKSCRPSSVQPSDIEPWRKTAPRGNAGAVSELLVAHDLFTKGYYVFRNMSPHGPCDLIALKDGQTLRVEVKTGYMRSNGNVTPGVAPRQIKHVDYDVIAWTYLKEVFYDREM